MARFYAALSGDAVPVRTSAVISGRGRMTVGGIAFPARFRFTHDAGRAYRHYFELTSFGVPVVRFDEVTGLPRFSESLRYREADSEGMNLWINELREWGGESVAPRVRASPPPSDA